MAVRLKDEPRIASSVLLDKLRKGQEELRRSFRVLNKAPTGRGSEERSERRRRELAVHRGGRKGGRGPLERVDNLTRKRARLMQLSPTTSSIVSSPSPSNPPPQPTHKHPQPRRLSSTPKTTSFRSPPPPPPPPDLSLEEAIFDGSRSEKTQMRRSFVDSSSSRRKRRGLSVSFLHNDAHKMNTEDKDHTLSFTAERDLGTSLIESLNTSRFGALDRRLSNMRKRRKFPRKYAGDDPKLGYDWIAGMVDANSCLSERDDEYFEEMKEFRRVNRSECFQPPEAMLPGSLVTEGERKGERTLDTSDASGEPVCTTCASSYVLNDRLFPVPVHHCSDLSHCPVCEGKHKSKPSPTRYVRVSVPRSSLLAPYKVRPHRRRSFDPTDSMGLSQHCLAGWETAKPSVIPPQSSIDLKSALDGNARSTSREGGLCSRKRSRDLLNTSHSVEYNLRSRSRKKLRKL